MSSTRALILPGRPEAASRPADDPPGFAVVHASRIDARARSAGAEHVFEDARDDDLLEIEYEGGVLRWTTVGRERARREHRDGLPLRGPLRLEPEAADAGRGVVDWLWKALRVLRLDPAHETARWTARQITDRFASRLVPGPGLHRIESPVAMERAQPAEGIDAHPHLVLLHGTFSSTTGSFGDLVSAGPGGGAPSPWQALRQAYGERILALEHDTLGRSPIDNALELARSLPQGARPHLLSHSRGGLVGELLCARHLSDAEIARYRRGDGEDRQAWDARDREALRELVSLLEARDVRVERFVRVACPARGTTLGERLDLFLSLALNLLSRVPALGQSPLYSFAKETVLALLRLRDEPELPGIEAMLPGSPLVRLLGSAAPSDADLAVIAGDLDGEGLPRALLEWASNVFYRESDHDLVVPTRSMDGGIPRRAGALHALAEGSRVDHFSYFRESDSAGWVVSGLREDEPRQGFTRPADRARAGATLRGPDGPPPEDRPCLVLLPGIMGSRLSVDGREIWVDFMELLRGGLGDLALGAAVSADGLLDRAYGDLAEHLARTHHVRPFAYDWRLSLRGAADALAGELGRLLDETSQPVRLLAHSMGGLVARGVMARHPDVWRRAMERPDARLVMLGTPNAGSFSIPRMLMGRDRLVRMLALLDFDHSLEELLQLVSGFPGVLELLPGHPSDDFDAFDPAAWEPLQAADEDEWSVPAADALAEARAFRDEIDAVPVDTEHTLYVAGQDASTPMDVEVRGRRVVFRATAEGDGRVPWSTGLLEGVRTWYMPVSHGDLSREGRHFPALEELLVHGQTARLPLEPPSRRGLRIVHDVPDVDDVVFPGVADLEDAAVGAGGAATPRGLPTLRVSALHGDACRRSGRPVLVGHHENDTIVSAEAALDRALGGRLRDRYQLGSYPGPIGTQAWFAQPEAREAPVGVLVMGLGQVGELGPAELESVVTRGVLELALVSADGTRDSGWEGRLAALLIGAGEGSRLSIRDSLRAITEGVLEANRRLRELGEPAWVRELEFVELFEDRAIAAARELLALEGTLSRSGPVRVARTLRSGPGGLQRSLAGRSGEAWWRRVAISRADGAADRLRFEVLTDRAGARAEEVMVQPTVLEHLSRLAWEGGAGGGEVGTLLLRHAVPRSLRGRLLEGERTLLLVDRDTASIPWELLAESDAGRGGLPYAVRSGMMRQFVGRRGRPDVRYARDGTALVIGDPSLDGTPGFAPLPGAREEARSVAGLLRRRGFGSQGALLGARWPEILRAIQRPVRVLHVAGHGVLDAEAPARSGVVLSEGVRITAAEVRAMDPVPEFVFLNCCYLARTGASPGAGPGASDAGENEWSRLAATLAEQLMAAGVRAVIAAGWPVGDASALTFAHTLYEELLRGQPLGTAVRIARESIHPGDGVTWGAYQCYGDPDFRLATRAEPVATLRAPVVARRELLERLHDLSRVSEGGREAVVRAVENELALAPPEWLDGEVYAAAADTLRQAGCLAEAAQQLERALRSPRPGAPLAAASQLAELRVASVSDVLGALAEGRRPAARERRAAQRTVRSAVRELEALTRLAPTAERHALLGRTCMHMAALALSDARPRWLRRAAEAYRLALADARERGGDVAGPALGLLLCELLADDEAPDGLTASQRDVLEAARSDAALRAARDDATLADRLRLPEVELVEALADGSLARDEVRTALRDACLRLRRQSRGEAFVAVPKALERLLLLVPPLKRSWKSSREALERLRDELA